MSATPIPRTLEMSITGIREMSTIQTPPEERHPVLTFVGPYQDKTIAAAVRRELLREGQVFYVHNRVETIDKAAKRLQELIPEARIATAHGQMNEHALEKVIVDFWEKAFDVLVCTTIVETGLDISNANTLIVERGDMLGLSQLHQLRGRVGRSRERGYAYFLYPPEKPLTETAHERLATIAQHTELGAGMYVAMKDLEIRGAGNLLGGEQSGHIEGVGFDLYVRMVGEAVAEYKAEAEGREPPPADVRVELPIDAHIPHAYVPGERLRLEAYRRIADVGAIVSRDPDADIDGIREELTDRYGPVPDAGREPAGDRAVPRPRPGGRRRGSHTRRQLPCGSARSTCGNRSNCGSKRLYPGLWSRRPSVRSWCRDRPPRASAGPRSPELPLLDWARAAGRRRARRVVPGKENDRSEPPRRPLLAPSLATVLRLAAWPSPPADGVDHARFRGGRGRRAHLDLRGPGDDREVRDLQVRARRGRPGDRPRTRRRTRCTAG